MTQEEKELLFKDLCARLPYGVIVDIKYSNENGSSDRLRICSEGSLTLNTDLLGLYIEGEIHLKPYLRPMSSMTEEERTEYFLLKHRDNDRDDNIILIDEASTLIDWLLSHHFDYRRLIGKGLALEVPEGMYEKE